jgi:hypothetical protein
MSKAYIHDLKRIADLMKELIKALDKLFIDVELTKGDDHGLDNAELGTGSSRVMAAGTAAQISI